LISATADMNIRLFVNNKVAMITGTAAEVLSIQKVEGLRFEAVPMPQGKSKQTSVYKSNVTGISAKTKQAEAAWKFMKFVRGPQGETIYMKAKRIPPTMDDKKFWDLYCDPTKYPKLIEQNSKAISSTYGHKLPLRAGWLEIDQTVGPALQLMFAKADVQAVPQALADLKKRVQPIMDRTGK
jgi:ABC-type glycerol-3-phosphate transport system substrate-binding protein